jgi:hypothetical protein
MQAKLLRALQERAVRPVGGDEERAATRRSSCPWRRSSAGTSSASSRRSGGTRRSRRKCWALIDAPSTASWSACEKYRRSVRRMRAHEGGTETAPRCPGARGPFFPRFPTLCCLRSASAVISRRCRASKDTGRCSGARTRTLRDTTDDFSRRTWHGRPRSAPAGYPSVPSPSNSEYRERPSTRPFAGRGVGPRTSDRLVPSQRGFTG